MVELILTPSELPQLFESFDSRNPRDYSKTYKEIGNVFAPKNNINKLVGNVDHLLDAKMLYIYPSRWYSFHKFTDEDFSLNLFNLSITGSNYDLYMSNVREDIISQEWFDAGKTKNVFMKLMFLL